ncbi:hypothetical protein SUGI_0285480 [Cryptomeria japonica]|nr:hypothetical protein SUGI_0285480 [Cryptomeria japonica]
MVFVARLLVGLIAGLNAYGLLTYYNNNTSPLQSQQESWDSCESMLTRAKTGTSLQHNMTDTELFCGALAVSSGEEIVSEPTPKIAFLFLVNDNLSLLPLWLMSSNKGNSRIFLRGHMVEPAKMQVEQSSLSYLTRGGTNACFLHQFSSFHVANFHKQVFHGRFAHMQLRIGRSEGRGKGAIPMEIATKRARVIAGRGGAHIPRILFYLL